MTLVLYRFHTANYTDLWNSPTSFLTAVVNVHTDDPKLVLSLGPTVRQ
jgi:hypothetical protein